MASMLTKLRHAVGMRTTAEQLTFETGLPVLETGPRPYERDEFLNTLTHMLEPFDLPALLSEWHRQFDAKSRFRDGASHASGVRAFMFRPIDAADGNAQLCEAALPRYEQLWRSNPRDPSASAVYGQALVDTGTAYRGSDWAERVRPRDWQKLAEYFDRSQGVINGCDTTRDTNWFWTFGAMRSAFAGLGIGAVPAHRVTDLYEQALSIAPHELSIYSDRAIHLLPRWGGSYQQLEIMARDAMRRTEHECGAELYARVYEDIRRLEPLHGTLVDHGLMLEGFVDWMRRCPSEKLANQFAAYCHHVGDTANLAQVLEHGLTEVHLDVWGDPEAPLDAWRSVRRKLVALPWKAAARTDAAGA